MKRPRILVVDDEEPIRMLLTDILLEQNYEVITAENGVEGVRCTFADVPDVVLTDVLMPDMNGLSFIKKVRSKLSPQKLPIIVVSALGMEDQIVRAFQAGATDYLVKPFRHPELLARIQVALRQRIDPDNVVLVEREGESGPRAQVHPGSVLDMGKYRILSEIGTGGMGTVYLAKHLGYGINVALKVLKPEMMEDRKNILRFLREVRIASRMNHPNIVDVFDMGLSGECHYYAMENLPRRSLFQIAREEGPLEESFVLDVGLQLSSALAYMHTQGFMHRDVKPDNILFQDENRLKLIDFGLACSADDNRLTREGTFIGTPGYVAPEYIRSYRSPEETIDIYSLGATLYFAAAGQSPFHYKNGSTQRLIAQVQEEAPPLQLVAPGISREFSAVVMKMLERSPDKRYSFMAQVHEDLEELRETVSPGNLVRS